MGKKNKTRIEKCLCVRWSRGLGTTKTSFGRLAGVRALYNQGHPSIVRFDTFRLVNMTVFELEKKCYLIRSDALG